MVLNWYMPLGKTWVLIGTCFVVTGCSKDAPLLPIVANPTEPWEEKLVQERREYEIAQQAQKPPAVVGQGYGYDQKPDEDKHSVIVTTLADIVAFPLRGAAWLVRTVL